MAERDGEFAILPIVYCHEMRAGAAIVVLSTVLGLHGAAHADDPKPKPVDISKYKAKLQLFRDAHGGTYAVLHEAGTDPVLFYGPKQTLFQQIIIGGSADGDAWEISTWAPRVKEIRPGAFIRHHDGSFEKTCDGFDDAKLTALTGDQAKQVLDKYAFVSTALQRRAHLLARDDSGVYYYVDRLYVKAEPNEKGTGDRVFVGRKGAMTQMPLVDIASDSSGEVYATKTGTLRLVHNQTDYGKVTTAWVKGEKRSELVWLDVDANSHLIYSDLGIYTFLGTLCDNN